MLAGRMRYYLHAGIPLTATHPHYPALALIGVYNVARSAAGAEIFRNLPHTAPLASQAHAVHMIRISME